MTDATTAAWLRQRLWVGWATGVGVWLTWVVSLGIGGFTRDAEDQLLGADHIAFYTAATLVREGHAGGMYDHDTLGGRQQRIVAEQLPGKPWPYFMAYRNPPFYALLYVPSSVLPFPLSVALWMLVGVAALGVAVWCLRPERPWRVFGWAFAFYPFFTAITFGQNTALSLAVFAAVYRLSAERRPVFAGLVAGLLWFKPQLLIGLFVWWGLAPRRHRGEWLGVTLTGLAFAAVSFVMIPDAAWAFVETLRANVTYGGENQWNLHSPRKFWDTLMPAAPRALNLTLTLVCFAAGLAGAAWVRVRTGGPLAVMFPVAVCVTLWASPHTLIYEWTLLYAAAVVLWERLPARRDTWLTLFVLAWVVLTVSTTATLVQIRTLGWTAGLQISIPVLAVVGVRLFRELGRPIPAAGVART